MILIFLWRPRSFLILPTAVSLVTGRMHLCPLGEGILATPEYEIHGFQIPYYTFQDANLRGGF